MSLTPIGTATLSYFFQSLIPNIYLALTKVIGHTISHTCLPSSLLLFLPSFTNYLFSLPHPSSNIHTFFLSSIMARSDVFSRQRWSEKTDNFGHDVHVLAVDDSLIDRKVIERLLKITSCKGTALLIYVVVVCSKRTISY